jgi:hypothetical protein
VFESVEEKVEKRTAGWQVWPEDGTATTVWVDADMEDETKFKAETDTKK